METCNKHALQEQKLPENGYITKTWHPRSDVMPPWSEHNIYCTAAIVSMLQHCMPSSSMSYSQHSSHRSSVKQLLLVMHPFSRNYPKLYIHTHTCTYNTHNRDHYFMYAQPMIQSQVVSLPNHYMYTIPYYHFHKDMLMLLLI